MRRSIASGALVVLAATALVGCGSDSKTTNASSGGGKTLAVTAVDFKFDPTSLSVAAGESVTVSVKNDGSTEHNFSFEEAKANTDVAKGASEDVTFTAPSKPGDYTYFCEYHKDRGMMGTIHVTGAAGSGGGAGTTETTAKSSGVGGY
jgi:plastocyanin